jgi:hypothetical protein
MIILTFGSICLSLLIAGKNNHIFKYAMAIIKVKDRKFERSINASVIDAAVQRVAGDKS